MPADGAGAACLDRATAVAYLAGGVEAARLAGIRSHLRACEACRRLLVAVCATDRTVLASGSSPASAAPPSALDDVVDDIPPGARIGRYIVLRRVGAGGMGVVYAAHDPELDRKVALKLLRPREDQPAEDEARLLREAQAMARLSHPNVIAVHDVGTLGGRVFFAMEFVDGRTLRDWLAERPRAPREALEVLIQAGRGLAAAHAGGVIHRDFKPDNVLVSADGRVRVTDFGLAAPANDLDAVGRPALAPELVAGRELTSSSGNLLDARLTRTGAVLGTPAYMALEQFEGRTVDARSDQFAFCVALHEALYGRRPFAGDSPVAIAAAVLAGRILPPPEGTHVPGWIRRVVLRGLAAAPEDRYPSMEALLAALARDPRGRWVRGAAVAAGLAVAIGALALLRPADRPPPLCRGAERRLVGVWDEPRRAAVHRAFTATRLGYAEKAWDGTATVLDAYARRWVTMHTEACEATSVRGERSAQLLDLRMACLDERLVHLRAVSDLFARADAEIVRHALDAASRLPPLDGCADLRALAERVPPPVDPDRRARALALGRRLAEARALFGAGKVHEALPAVAAIVEEARAVEHPPILARAAYLHGNLLTELADYAGAEARLREAARLADGVRDDELRLRALIDLVFVVGRGLGRNAEARELGRDAHALRARAGDAHDRIELESNMAVLLQAEGKLDEALEAYREVLALAEARSGPDSAEAARMLSNLGNALGAVGRFDEASEALRRALAVSERIFGAGHPEVATTLHALGLVAYDRGRLGEAQAHHRRALAIREEALGKDSVMTAGSLQYVGSVQLAGGDVGAAKATFRRQLAILERAAPESADMAGVLNNLGSIAVAEGDLAQGEALVGRALAIERRLGEPRSPRVAHLLDSLAAVHFLSGRPAFALAEWEESLSIVKATVGAEHPDAARGALGVGLCRLALGEPAAAIPLFEEAIRVAEGAGSERTQVAGEARFGLARALVATGRDARRAVALARRARGELAAAGDEATAAEVDAWLRKRR